MSIILHHKSTFTVRVSRSSHGSIVFLEGRTHQPYKHWLCLYITIRLGILVHGAGRRVAGYDVCLLTLSPSHVGLLKLITLLHLCLCPWNLLHPPASLQGFYGTELQEPVGGYRSHRDLSVAHPVFAHPPPLWEFSVITMETPLGNWMGLKKPPHSLTPSPTHRVDAGLFSLNCYVFNHTHKQNSFSDFWLKNTNQNLFKRKNTINSKCLHISHLAYVYSFIWNYGNWSGCITFEYLFWMISISFFGDCFQDLSSCGSIGRAFFLVLWVCPLLPSLLLLFGKTFLCQFQPSHQWQYHYEATAFSVPIEQTENQWL